MNLPVPQEDVSGATEIGSDRYSGQLNEQKKAHGMGRSVSADGMTLIEGIWEEGKPTKWVRETDVTPMVSNFCRI